jgi:hypothetical protein
LRVFPTGSISAAMILVTGNDPVVEALCAALDAAGRDHRRVDALSHEAAVSARAKTVVLIEPLPRFGAPPPTHERALRELISAANAPGVRTAIVVTSRPDADPELRAVRRSGIPYTILRPLPLVDPVREPARRVLVPRQVAAEPAAAVTIDVVTDAVLAALDGAACGQTNELAPPPSATWLDVLERAGAAPRAVPGWRARLGRWFGAHTLDPRRAAPDARSPAAA